MRAHTRIITDKVAIPPFTIMRFHHSIGSDFRPLNPWYNVIALNAIINSTITTAQLEFTNNAKMKNKIVRKVIIILSPYLPKWVLCKYIISYLSNFINLNYLCFFLPLVSLLRSSLFSFLSICSTACS